LATSHEEIDSSANVIAILAFSNGTAFHEHSHAAKGCHGDRVLPTGSFPVAIFMLIARHPSQAFFNGVLVLFGDFIALQRGQGDAQKKQCDSHGFKIHVLTPGMTFIAGINEGPCNKRNTI
jgi:hypothetical protein